MTSTSALSKIGPESLFNTYTEGEQKHPSITSLQDGGFLVVWQAIVPTAGSFGPNNIYGQRYDANGNRIGTEFLISTNNEDYSYVSSASAISLAEGGFVVTWLDNARSYGQGYDVSGNPIGTPFQVSTFDYISSSPSSTSLVDGGFIVTWSETISPRYPESTSYGQRYDANGNPIGTSFVLNRRVSSVTYLANGGFVVAWSAGYNAYSQIYDSNNNPIGSEFQVNTSTNNVQSYAKVTTLSNGGFVVTWETFSSRDNLGRFLGIGIYGQRYDADGNQVGSEFQINTQNTNTDLSSTQQHSITALKNGGFVVTWESNELDAQNLFTMTSLYGQRYDANGSKLGDQFKINSSSSILPRPSSIVSLSSPSVTSLDNGRFVVAYSASQQDDLSYDQNIYGQVFGQVPAYGVFNLEQLAHSGFVSGLSYTPVEVGGLPLASLYDETFYLSHNQDVANAVSSGVFSNGYTHFVNFGQFEGRDPSILYDETFYLEHNPDVANAVATGSFLSGFEHYALYGQQEGRSPSEVFNEQAYRIANPDVADVITNGSLRSGFEHYIESGQAEGRYPLNSLYNEAYYLAQNSDVANAVAMGMFQDGFEHYINYGQSEKRNPSSLLNESQYLTLNPDVANAVNSGLLSSGFEHYILFGRAKGREI